MIDVLVVLLTLITFSLVNLVPYYMSGVLIYGGCKGYAPPSLIFFGVLGLLGSFILTLAVIKAWTVFFIWVGT
jgi:hypothetical protein